MTDVITSEIIDQVGGWSIQKIGHKYGKGFELMQIYEWIKNIY